MREFGLSNRDPATTAALLDAGAGLSAAVLGFTGFTGSGYSSHVLARPMDVPGQPTLAFAATSRVASALAPLAERCAQASTARCTQSSITSAAGCSSRFPPPPKESRAARMARGSRRSTQRDRQDSRGRARPALASHSGNSLNTVAHWISNDAEHPAMSHCRSAKPNARTECATFRWPNRLSPQATSSELERG
jgi:hypothetical protein